jgi:hypothetical protein
MEKVVVKLGDIFEGSMDLTVLPCSAKGSISSSTERWKKIFGFDSPNDLGLILEHGAVSDLIAFPSQHKQTRYFIYAASVFNSRCSYEIVKGIGAKIGLLAESNKDIVHIETPLLGAGAGRLPPEMSGRALCEGFLSASNDESILFIFANDEKKHIAVSKAISKGFAGRLLDAIEVKPGFGGVAVDLKKVFKRKH